MRFDFYLIDSNLLVEIDDWSHLEDENQITNGKIKNEYCIEHKLKLLRIDESVGKDEFQKAIETINEDDIYVFKYRRYRWFTLLNFFILIKMILNQKFILYKLFKHNLFRSENNSFVSGREINFLTIFFNKFRIFL